MSKNNNHVHVNFWQAEAPDGTRGPAAAGAHEAVAGLVSAYGSAPLPRTAQAIAYQAPAVMLDEDLVDSTLRLILGHLDSKFAWEGAGPTRPNDGMRAAMRGFFEKIDGHYLPHGGEPAFTRDVDLVMWVDINFRYYSDGPLPKFEHGAVAPEAPG